MNQWTDANGTMWYLVPFSDTLLMGTIQSSCDWMPNLQMQNWLFLAIGEGHYEYRDDTAGKWIWLKTVDDIAALNGYWQSRPTNNYMGFRNVGDAILFSARWY